MGLQTADLPVNPSSEIDITTESTHAESHADEVQTPEANLIGLIDTGLNQDEDPADTLTALVNSDQDHGRRVLGFKREDKSGWIQKARSKQNITYESTEGKSFFAKYATKMEGYRDTVAGLKKEKRMLDKLAATGVVPQAGELKFYPDEHNPQREDC